MRISPMLLGLAAAAALAVPVGAGGVQVPFRQLTFTEGCPSVTGLGGNTEASFRPDGRELVFVSTCDLVPGDNVDGDAELFRMNVDGSGLVQLTSAVGGQGSVQPFFSTNGHDVAFASDRDLVAGGNSDGNLELFMMNADGTALRQLTSTTGGYSIWAGSQWPRLDAAGREIVFVSDRDLVPGSNADQNFELFSMSSDGTGVRQLTSTTGLFGQYSPSLNAAGTEVAFTSDLDLVPGGNTDRNRELYLMNVDGSGLRQLTSTTGGGGGSTVPTAISRHGRTVALHSDRDLVPGGNPDGNLELYLASVAP